MVTWPRVKSGLLPQTAGWEQSWTKSQSAEKKHAGESGYGNREGVVIHMVRTTVWRYVGGYAEFITMSAAGGSCA